MLSTGSISRLLNDKKLFKKDDGCVKILNEILHCKVNGFHKSSSKYKTTRYCNQKYFKLLVCGGYNTETSMTCSNVRCIDVNKVKDVEPYPLMTTGRLYPEVVYFKSEIYVFGGWIKNVGLIKSVEKYSSTSKTWNQVTEMKDDRNFCIHR